MKRNLKILSALVVAGVGVAWALLPPGSAVATACDGTAVSLNETAPAQLVAIFDRDCAAALVDEQGLGLAYDFGYPSLVLQHASADEANAAIDATIAEGDRGFFANDPAVLEQLDGAAADFVRASLFPQDALAAATDPSVVLQSVPLWNANQNAPIIIAGCETTDCDANLTDCAGYVGLADKHAIATGEKTLADVYASCPISPTWVLGLRRAGLVDTACTSTLAVNRVMDAPETLGDACFPADFDAQTLPGIGSADLPRLLRVRGPSGLADIEAGNMLTLQSFFPSIVTYITQNGDL
ncbi:hypothetical protein [Yoonia sp.]|uniref:hypothetical protein n=1 Tax=Yoonia sp. TaxID=2212373 RepID=UPI0032662FB6